MKDAEQKLMNEIIELRRRISELEAGERARRQTEDALQESERKYRRLVQDSIDGIAIVQELEIRFVNQAFLEMFGYPTEDEMIGRPFTDFVSPEYRKVMAERGVGREGARPRYRGRGHGRSGSTVQQGDYRW